MVTYTARPHGGYLATKWLQGTSQDVGLGEDEVDEM